MFKNESSNEIRILDFGLSSKRRTGVMTSGRRGTLNYMAPEVLLGNVFTEQADVWSAGIICYRLFTGTRPWSITAKRKFSEPVMKKMLDITKVDWPEYIPKEARDVILASCRWEAEKRATAAEVLNFPWFLGEGKHMRMDSNTIDRLHLFAMRGKLQHMIHDLVLKNAKIDCDLCLRQARNFFHQDADEFNQEDHEFTKEEFGDFLDACRSKSAILQRTEVDQDKVFEALCTGDKETISFEDFMGWYQWDYIMKQDQRLWNFIATLDRDNDGFIDLGDIESAFAEHVDSEDIKAYLIVFREAFEGQDSISVERFGHLIRQDVNEDYTHMKPNSMESEFLFTKKQDYVKNAKRQKASFGNLVKQNNQL